MRNAARSAPIRATLLFLLAASAAACAGAPPRPAPPPAPPEFFMNVDGAAGRLRVSVGGEGEPTVVFVHGLGGDLEAWRGQLDHVRHTRAAVAYDQRGHGESDRASDGVYTIAALVDDLDAVLRGLKLGRVVLVGHSLSGAVLTEFAARHPDAVAGLVYLDAVGDFSAIPREAIASMIAREAAPTFGATERRAAFAEMLGTAARPGTRSRVLASLDRMDPPAFAALRRSMTEFSARERYARYRGPVLAIEAAASAGQPVMASKVLKLPVLTVSGTSHWVQLDDPDAVNGKLDAFLAGLR
jgi:pimeloyl-ACP methyl ester carboxylesterase